MNPGKHGCTGTTAKGTTCNAHARPDTDRCPSHPHDVNASRARMPRNQRWDRRAFLAHFESCGMVTEACERLGVSRTIVYDERARNPEFAEAWTHIEEATTERMETEAFRRAVLGVSKPLVSMGKLVTEQDEDGNRTTVTVQEYSDSLLQFMLKGRRPNVYRDNVKVEHSGTVKHELVPVRQDVGAVAGVLERNGVRAPLEIAKAS